VTEGTITIGTAAGNGAVGVVSYLEGRSWHENVMSRIWISSRMRFPPGSIPSTFTICSVTRYSGATRQRILDGLGANWLHGHNGGSAGVSYYNGWATPSSNQLSPNTDWLIHCGQNSGDGLQIINGGTSIGTATSGTGNIRLTIMDGNHRNAVSDWQAMEIAVWDRALTLEEINTVVGFYDQMLATTLTPTPTSTPTATPTNIGDTNRPTAVPTVVPTPSSIALFDSATLHVTPSSFYDSFPASRWDDVSGNCNHGTVTEGSVTVGTAAGNGAVGVVSYLEGTTSSRMRFPPGSIPSTFTICSVTRYSGAAKRRILDGLGANWLHGHYGGSAGVSYYNGWATPNSNQLSPNTDWLIHCGQNGGDGLQIINGGTSIGTATSGTGNIRLTIMDGSHRNEVSDWQAMEIAVWDRALTLEEINTVVGFYDQMLATTLMHTSTPTATPTNIGDTNRPTAVPTAVPTAAAAAPVLTAGSWMELKIQCEEGRSEIFLAESFDGSAASYPGQIDFTGKTCVIRGENQVIDMGSAGRFAFAEGCHSSLEVHSLNIQNGNVRGHGGAVFISGSLVKLAIYNSSFISNKMTAVCRGGCSPKGGAIYTSSASLTLWDTTFESNTAPNWDGSDGGGVYASGSAVEIHTCLFINNKALRVQAGGAIYIDSSSLVIRDTAFEGSYAHWGAALYARGSRTKVKIYTSTFGSNTANKRGGGGAIWINNDAELEIHKTTFTSNTALGFYSYSNNFASGGAIRCNFAKVAIHGSTFAFNSAERGGAVSSTGGTLTIRDTRFERNRAAGHGGE
jgi:hypothetical protein